METAAFRAVPGLEAEVMDQQGIAGAFSGQDAP